MPRVPKNKPSGDFESFFDDELEDLDTPEDTIDSISENEIETKNEIVESILENSTNSTLLPTQNESLGITHVAADKFGLSKTKKNQANELVARTLKFDTETLRRVEDLIYKDQRHSKKIPGTKGFLSDFMDNAIWQHLYQLGLATEEEVNEHLKDYSKYPLNFDKNQEK